MAEYSQAQMRGMAIDQAIALYERRNVSHDFIIEAAEVFYNFANYNNEVVSIAKPTNIVVEIPVTDEEKAILNV